MAAIRALYEHELRSGVVGGPVPALERAIVRHAVMSGGGDLNAAVAMMVRIQQPLLEGQEGLAEDRRQALDDLCKDDQTAAALVFAAETVLRNRNANANERFDRSVMDMVTKQSRLARIAAQQQYELDNPDLSDLIEDALVPVKRRLQMELDFEELDPAASPEPAQTLNQTRHRPRHFSLVAWLGRILTRMFP